MAIAFVTGTNVGFTDAPDGGTTSPGVDTTGVDLFVGHNAFYNGVSATSPLSHTVSSTNYPWTQLTSYVVAGLWDDSLWCLKNPPVGTGTVFINGGTQLYGSAQYAGFSGSDLSAPLDQQSGLAQIGGTTIEADITPTTNGQLIVSGASTYTTTQDITGTPSGYTLSTISHDNPGTTTAGAMAYLIQTTAGLSQPTWAYDSGNAAISNASFKAAAGGGGTAALTGQVTAQLKGKGAANFATSISAKLTSQLKGKAASNYSVGISGKSTLQNKGKAASSYRVGLFGKITSQLKANATFSGTVALAARAAMRVLASATFGSGAVALFAKATSMFKSAASATFAVGLSAQSTSQTKSNATFSGALALAGRITTRVLSNAYFGSGTAALFARSVAMFKSSAIFSGTVGLTAKSTSQIKNNAGASYLASLAARSAAFIQGKSVGTYSLALNARSMFFVHAKAAQSTFSTSFAASGRTIFMFFGKALATLRDLFPSVDETVIVTEINTIVVASEANDVVVVS